MTRSGNRKSDHSGQKKSAIPTGDETPADSVNAMCSMVSRMRLRPTQQKRVGRKKAAGSRYKKTKRSSRKRRFRKKPSGRKRVKGGKKRRLRRRGRRTDFGKRRKPGQRRRRQHRRDKPKSAASGEKEPKVQRQSGRRNAVALPAVGLNPSEAIANNPFTLKFGPKKRPASP